MHDEDGVQVITKLDSWSKAKAKAGILGQQLQPNLSTKIVSYEETTNEVDCNSLIKKLFPEKRYPKYLSGKK